MSISAMKQAYAVPLIEQLESVPTDARMMYEHDKSHHQNIPVGRLCHEAAAALRQAIAEAESQQQIAEDFIKYGASWSKRGKRIDPSEIYAPAQTPVHASDISQEHVDETVKSEHEFECPRCGHCCQQREWVGLTDGEVNEFAAGCHLGNSVQGAIYKAAARLKEKNT